jgi:hypothetical protein
MTSLGLRQPLAFAAAAAVVAVPWLARNLVWTGNPVYPLLYSVFDGAGWSTAQARQYAMDNHGFGIFSSLRHAGLELWQLSFAPFSRLIERHGAFGVIGPFFAWLVPIAVGLERRD